MPKLATGREILLPKTAEKDRSLASRLSAAAATFLATTVFALIPLVVDPYDVVYLDLQSFYQSFLPPKFELLLVLSGLLLAVMLAAWLSGAEFIRVPMLLPAAAFLAISALSTALAEDAYLGLVGLEGYHDGLLSTASGVLLFYAVARFLDSWAKVRFFLRTGVAVATLVAAYGISQRFGFDPLFDLSAPAISIPNSGGIRVFSTIGNPIYLAAYLTLMVGCAATLYLQAGPRRERVLWLTALAMIGACWFYTYTRGAILGAGIALPVVLGLTHRRMGTVRPLLVPLATLAVAILVAAALGYLADHPTQTAPDAGTQEASPSSDSAAERLTQARDENTLSRLLIWRDTVPVILERPLLGYGPDNFREPFSRHQGGDLEALMTPPNMTQPIPVDKAHNELLQVAATTGLLGIAAYVWVLAAYFRNSYTCGRWTLVTLSGGVLAYILQLQTIFTTLATGIAFWAILGVSAAIMRLPPDSQPLGKAPPNE